MIAALDPVTLMNGLQPPPLDAVVPQVAWPETWYLAGSREAYSVAPSSITRSRRQAGQRAGQERVVAAAGGQHHRLARAAAAVQRGLDPRGVRRDDSAPLLNCPLLVASWALSVAQWRARWAGTRGGCPRWPSSRWPRRARRTWPGTPGTRVPRGRLAAPVPIMRALDTYRCTSTWTAACGRWMGSSHDVFLRAAGQEYRVRQPSLRLSGQASRERPPQRRASAESQTPGAARPAAAGIATTPLVIGPGHRASRRLPA